MWGGWGELALFKYATRGGREGSGRREESGRELMMLF